MEKIDMLGLLENADESIIDELTELCEPLDGSADERIFAMIEKKCVLGKTYSEGYEDVVEGVDIYMKKTWKNAITAAAAVIILAGGTAGGIAMHNFAKNGNQSTSVADSENYDTPLLLNCYFDNYTDGRIYGGIEPGSETPSMYIDYATMESTVLCSKPNCRHNGSDCLARSIGTCPILLNNKIIYFKSTNGIKELKKGEREHYIQSELYTVNLDSSEIKRIISFSDCVPNDSCGYLLYNNKIYFIGDDLNPKFDEYGGLTTSNIGGRHYLCSIDLNSGSYTNYGSVYDGDKEYEAADYTSSAQIIGFYNSKIIINYEFKKEFDNSDPEKAWTELVFEFDPVKNELKRSDIPVKPSFVSNDTIIYYDSENKKTVVIENNERKELDIYIGKKASLLNNKLFTNDKDSLEMMWYDMSDLSVHYIKNHVGFTAISCFNDSYILTLGNKTEKITEQELLALDSNGE